MKRIVDGEWREAAPSPAMEELPVGVAGVFETVLLLDGAPIFWPEHWARFETGCRTYGIAAPFAGDALRANVQRLAAEDRVANGVIRFAVWRTRAGTISSRVEVSPPRPHMARAEARVTFGPTLLPPQHDRSFKHLGRSDWFDALREARAAGWDEALVFDGTGMLLEGCGSNIFLVRDGTLHTPALSTGCLPGVMRAKVVEFVRQHGFTLAEGRLCCLDLDAAEAIWLTNSLIGIRPVAVLGDRSVPSQHPLLERLRIAWRQAYGWDPVVVLSS